jgi:putative membrane protein
MAAGMSSALHRRFAGCCLLLAAVPCSVASCAGGGGQQESSPERTDAALVDATRQTHAPGPAPLLCSDGQLAAAMEAANQSEVELAQTVRDGLTSPGAIALEEKLLTDHSLLLEMAQGAARAARIAPVDNGLSRALASAGRADLAALGTLTGAALDQAYVDGEVLAHIVSLSLLERVLVPGESTDRFAYVIESMRDLETQHEAAALAAQRALEGSCDVAGDP